MSETEAHEVARLKQPPVAWECRPAGRGNCTEVASYRIGYRYHDKARGPVWRDLYVCRRHAEAFTARHSLVMPKE